nr:calcium-transporting ATPase 10, plasma membrane-type-like [Tanacetum cinerariifolium]
YNAGCKWLFLQGHQAYVEHIRLSQCPKKFNKPPQLSSSPYRRNRNPKDLEAGSGEGDEEYDAYDPFDIVRMKSASVDRLERCTDVL